MKNKEKISELSRKHQGNMTDAQYLQMMYAIEEMSEWKDAQNKENMLKFMRWLEKRGFIKEDLCYDTEHQVDTFINQILPQLKNC